MAFELIFELGLWFFTLVFIGALVIAIITLFDFGLDAFRTDRSGDFAFAIIGALVLVSILMMVIGAIVIALTS
jgi:hypothetical protein